MHARLTSAETFLPAIDRLVAYGLAMLIVATPIAIGAVNRGAVAAMELAIFGMAGLWITRSAISGMTAASNPLLISEARRLAFPLAAMVVLLSVQLTPVPPQILHLLSPAAYRIYQIAFPGWPYGNRRQIRSRLLSDGTHSVFMPGLNSAGSLKTPVQPPSGRRASTSATPASTIYPFKPGRWRTLTLSPAVTSASLLEFLALVAVFFLVLLYPFSTGRVRSAETQFVRRMVYLIGATAAIVALLGIAERAWWNGKILWFYQPADWTGPLLVDSPRASGPFVDPDHFANYLAMTLPLVIAGALFPLSLIPSRERPNARLLFGAAALLMLIAAALSLSRGGELAICVGVTSMLAMSFHWAADFGPAILRRLGLGAVPLSIVTFALMAGLTFYVIGGPARNAVRMRVVATSAGDFSARASAWRETLTMITEFPLFGVGAGAWPEIFPHYQPPPESRYFFARTAEDDYLQFLAENGVAGLIILLTFGTLVIRAVVAAALRMPPRRWPLLAGLLGGISGGLVHEFVDSSLHIPANALLFTILLALMLRVALAEPGREQEHLKAAEPVVHRASLRLLLAPAAIILMIAAWNQDGRTYPYTLDHPANLMMADHDLLEHPAMSAVHLALARMMPADAIEFQRSELSAAVWLDPNEPLARDLLARNLLLASRKPEALAQLSASVYRAPFLDLHYYLAPSAIPWLLPEEQEAIARGFGRAIDSNFTDAANQLASFYMSLGREREAAEAYEHAAQVTSDDSGRLDLLLKAGLQYARLRDYANGAQVLLRACSIEPDDPRAYAELAHNIYGPENKLAAAAAIIDQGVKAGADPYTLEMALANAAEMTGRHQVAETALARALDYDPSFDAMLLLGRVYFAENRFGRAVATLQQATGLNPQSAEAFMWLGRAHEANYDYYHAARAYRHAMSLAPADKDLRNEYHEFQRKIIPGDKSTGMQ
ncbi:MAG: O-antigen ligase family protein [Deltaproteobacteria bacterium]|nr:O-antigen ligase family protein [Deltaproteobacteria bacterium]